MQQAGDLGVEPGRKVTGAHRIQIAHQRHQGLQQHRQGQQQAEEQGPGPEGQQIELVLQPGQALQQRQAGPLLGGGGRHQTDGQEDHPQGGALAEAAGQGGEQVDDQQAPVAACRSPDQACGRALIEQRGEEGAQLTTEQGTQASQGSGQGVGGMEAANLPVVDRHRPRGRTVL